MSQTTDINHDEILKTNAPTIGAIISSKKIGESKEKGTNSLTFNRVRIIYTGIHINIAHSCTYSQATTNGARTCYMYPNKSNSPPNPETSPAVPTNLASRTNCRGPNRIVQEIEKGTGGLTLAALKGVGTWAERALQMLPASVPSNLYPPPPDAARTRTWLRRARGGGAVAESKP